MQSTAWAALLRRIPSDQQNTLAIMTTIGIEMNIQDILRIDGDHVVIRGRQAGTIAMGRVFFIPYQQISYIYFQKEVKEPQIRCLYSDSPAAGAAEAVDTSSQESAATQTEVAQEKAEPAPPPAEVKQPLEPPRPTQLKIPRKSGLIERLRARAQAIANSKPPAP